MPFDSVQAAGAVLPVHRSDEIYDNLDGELSERCICVISRLAPRWAKYDEDLEKAMALARETVRLGLGARGKAKIKVRQPLGKAVVVADGREREAIKRLADIVREELNVREIRFVAGAEELGRYEIKANYRTLGPLFGKDMPLAAQGNRGARPGVNRRRLTAKAPPSGSQCLVVSTPRPPRICFTTMRKYPRAGYSVEREGAHAVALDLTIDR